MNEFLFLLLATPTFAILGLGFLLGLKHATEADHLAAVSTMVSERRSMWSSALVGGLWGLGHTISLFVAGVYRLFGPEPTSVRIAQALLGALLPVLVWSLGRRCG